MNWLTNMRQPVQASFRELRWRKNGGNSRPVTENGSQSTFGIPNGWDWLLRLMNWERTK
jgi:hypothetical protein